MKIFVTKNVLTAGITNFALKEGEGDHGHVMKAIASKDLHDSHESAKVRAEVIRDRAIKTLQNRIEKLKAIQF